MSPRDSRPSTPSSQDSQENGNNEAAPSVLKYACMSCKKRKVKCDRKQPMCSACAVGGFDCVPGTRAPYPQRKRKRQPSEHSEDGDGTVGPRQSDRSRSSGLGIGVSGPGPGNSTLLRKVLEPEGPPPVGSSEGRLVPTLGYNLWVGLPADQFQYPGRAPSETDDNEVTPVPSSFLAASGLVFPRVITESAALSGAYPSAVNHFFLWEKFLQNVNPLTKVIHQPTLQTKLVLASQDFTKVSRPMSALLFAIYAAAVSSMTDDECRDRLHDSRMSLLPRYIAAAQQALVAAGFMGSTSMTVTQAFFLYLVSIRRVTDAQTFLMLTGMCCQMCQRLKMHLDGAEGAPACSVFKTQMRRRLWWAVLFMHGRAGQHAGHPSPFYPHSEFPLPANLHDSDLYPTMTETPVEHHGPTDMIFCLIRYEIGRLSHRVSSKLKSLQVSIKEKDFILDEFSDHIEKNFLKQCDKNIPLHRIAAGGALSATCKMRLMIHHPAQYPDKGASMPPEERHMNFVLSMNMVEMDLMGASSKLGTGFSWHTDVYFQLDAFVFMLIESRHQPPGDKVDRAWEMVSEMYLWRPVLASEEDTSDGLYRSVQELTIRAWDACQAKRLEEGMDRKPEPTIVTELRQMRTRKIQENSRVATTASTGRVHDTGPETLPNGNMHGNGFDKLQDPMLADALPSADVGFQDPTLVDGLVPFDWDWDYWSELLQNNVLYMPLVQNAE